MCISLMKKYKKMKKKKLEKIVDSGLLDSLKNNLQDLLDSKLLTWGKIYEVDFKQEFNLPFGGHTAHKIHKGRYVSKRTIMAGLTHFKIPFELKSGFIQPLENEE